MLAAGIVLLAASWLSGRNLNPRPFLVGIAALAYLAIFGSLIAINAYMFFNPQCHPGGRHQLRLC